MSSAPKVLVKENVGESGIQTLRDAGFDVELGFDWADGELERPAQRVRRHPDPLGHQAHRRCARARPAT